MTDDTTSDWEAIDEEAALWHARLEAGSADQDAFEQWRDADPRHSVAFSRILATANLVDDLNVEDLGDDPDLRTGTGNRRHFLKLGAGALAVTIGTGAWVMTQQRASATTLVGERKSVTLVDGVRFDLNTDTHVTWRFNGSTRRLWLKRGEVSVFVRAGAKPCDLTAGSSTVTIRGGDVNARLRTSALDLTVVNGASDVAVDGAGTTLPVKSGEGLLAGAGEARVRAITAGDMAFTTAWRDDAMVFDGQTLGVAVEEYNRYLPSKIDIIDPELAGLRIGGRFSTRDPRDFLETLRTSFGVHVSTASNGTVLLTK